MAGWDLREQRADISLADHLQKRVRGIVLQPPDLYRSVVESESPLPAKPHDTTHVESLLAPHRKSFALPEIDQPHDPPKVIQPIRIIKLH